MVEKLYRSEENKIVAGIHGGIGEYFSIDPVIVRIIGIIVALVTGVIPYALLYLLLVLVVPKKSEQSRIIDIE